MGPSNFSGTWECLLWWNHSKVYADDGMERRKRSLLWRSSLFGLGRRNTSSWLENRGNHQRTSGKPITFDFLPDPIFPAPISKPGARCMPILSLQREIETLNTPSFKFDMNWQNFMTSLLETYQDIDDPEVQPIIRQWQEERNCTRARNKSIFNPQFGSMFRSHLNPTFFSRRVFRFADIYTSNITNLLRYSGKWYLNFATVISTIIRYKFS